MARKRMILEEIAEPNPLVPGTPENPIKLGEKAKTILVHMKLYEDDGRTGRNMERYDDDYRQALERLEYLKLIEYLPQYDDAAIAAKQIEIEVLRQQLAESADTMSINGLHNICNSIRDVQSKIDGNKKVARLTDAGTALLLSGTVTVSL